MRRALGERHCWRVTSVLVAYASKRGSTAEIAHVIADALRECGLNVDCAEAGEVAGVEPYDAVVLGSAVYIRHWRGDAKHFLHTHGKQLSQRPFWVFSSGPVGAPKDGIDPSWLEPPRVIEAVVGLGARGHVIFGGRLPADPRGPMERTLVTRTPAEYRDRRDWGEIREWAAGIASELGVAMPSA
jgi:menaquinone-dependent protoporphyrinogen oxidase